MALEQRGAQSGWSFASTDTMRISLTNGLLKLMRLNDLKTSAPDLDRFVRAYEAALKREWGPYPGCKNCPAICIYHSEVTRLLSPIEYGHIEATLSEPSYPSQKERYEAMQGLLQGIARQWLGGESAEAKEIGYCLGLTAAPIIGLNEYEQFTYSGHLGRLLL